MDRKKIEPKPFKKEKADDECLTELLFLDSRKGSCYRRYHKMARYLFQWKTFRILLRSIE